MLEETALIKRIDGQHAWVETRAQVSCERCAAGRGCGAGTLAQAFGNASQPEVRVRLKPVPPEPGSNQTSTQTNSSERAPVEATKAGDAVIVGIDERAIVSGSLVLYGLPLLAMVMFAITAALITTNDSITAIAGAVGLASGIAASRSIAKRLGQQSRFEPQILRRLPEGSWESSCSKNSELRI